LIRIRIRIRILASKTMLKPLKKSYNRLIFLTFWLHPHIDADPDPVPDPDYHFDVDPDFVYADADPDADSGYRNDAEPDPQHWLPYLHTTVASLLNTQFSIFAPHVYH
jgi:hypothetical protein